MNYQKLIFDIRDRVAYVTLNRPDALNSLDMALKHELEDAICEIEKNNDIWGVIITGSGKAFCAGTDINGFPSQVEDARKITLYSQQLFNRIEKLEKPVIAVMTGFALGGGLELALVCDIRIASAKAKMGFPEVKISAIPCYGGTQRLTRLIGAGKTKEIIYTGDMISAQDALELGIINHVTEPGKEMEMAEELMQKILRNAPMAVAYSKRCINLGPEISLDYALDLEANLVSMLVPTEDMKEGTTAFFEKRDPVFRNR